MVEGVLQLRARGFGRDQKMASPDSKHVLCTKEGGSGAQAFFS